MSGGNAGQAGAPVLVVSHLFEPGVNRVLELLDTMAVPWRRLNCEDFPLLLRAGWTIDSDGGAAASVDAEGGAFSTDAVRSIWYRRLAHPALPASMLPRDRQFVRNEVAAFFDGALFDSDAFAINPRDAERRASGKLRQLRTAASLGLAVPRTLVTNDPVRARRFRDEAAGRVIFKPVSGFAPRGNDFTGEADGRYAAYGPVVVGEADHGADVEVVFAQILDDEKAAALDGLVYGPVIFQTFVEKVADIRVTIVGDAIFACRIHSQARAETSIDFRRMTFLSDRDALRHELFDLPPDLCRRLLALMDELGLVFGCIDLVEDADGGMTFLEVNPAGQWMWVEYYTGAPISEHLALLLAQGHA